MRQVFSIFKFQHLKKHFIWIGGNFFWGLVVITYTLLLSGSCLSRSHQTFLNQSCHDQNLIERSVPRISKTISWGCKQNLHSFEALCNTKHRWTGKHLKNQNTLNHEMLLDVGCNYLVPFNHKCAMARIFSSKTWKLPQLSPELYSGIWQHVSRRQSTYTSFQARTFSRCWNMQTFKNRHDRLMHALWISLYRDQWSMLAISQLRQQVSNKNQAHQMDKNSPLLNKYLNLL